MGNTPPLVIVRRDGDVKRVCVTPEERRQVADRLLTVLLGQPVTGSLIPEQERAARHYRAPDKVESKG